MLPLTTGANETHPESDYRPSAIQQTQLILLSKRLHLTFRGLFSLCFSLQHKLPINYIHRCNYSNVVLRTQNVFDMDPDSVRRLGPGVKEEG